MSFKEKLDYYGFIVVFSAGLAGIITMLLTGITI
jgi:hypothetical protein